MVSYSLPIDSRNSLDVDEVFDHCQQSSREDKINQSLLKSLLQAFLMFCNCEFNLKEFRNPNLGL